MQFRLSKFAVCVTSIFNICWLYRDSKYKSEIGMECLIGIQCKDFALVAADMTTAQSIIVMKSGKMFIFAYSTVKLYTVGKPLSWL